MVDVYDIPITWDSSPEIDVDYYEIYRHSGSYVLTSVNPGMGSVGLSGNQTALFPVNTLFNIIGSTGNDGEYTVKTVSYESASDRTIIYVTGTISDNTVDGAAYLFKLARKTINNAAIDKDLSVGTYYYKIRTVDTMGNESPFSNIVTKTSPIDAIAPSTPTNLIARRFDDFGGVKITWHHVTETDLKGYLVWRTFDGLSWHIVGKTNKNEWKDDDIPIADDLAYNATYVSYAVTAYDRYNNQSVSTAASDVLIIPKLKSIRVLENYLSLNVYWKEPLAEDNVTDVEIWYKKSTDSAYTFAESIDSPVHAGSIDGPLDEDTVYDIILSVLPAYLTIIDVDVPLKEFMISGDFSNYFDVGDTITVSSSTGNDGNYTVVFALYNPSLQRTTIQVTEVVPSAVVDGYVNTTTPRAPIPQVPLRSVKIADFDTDTTAPDAPVNLHARPDPGRKQLHLAWARGIIDDDFLYYKVEVYNPDIGDYILYTKTTNNNITLYNADEYTEELSSPFIYDVIAWRVSAVDRSGNESNPTPVISTYSDLDLAAGNYLPSWLEYTIRDLTDFKEGANDVQRRYDLVWNDAGRLAKYFKNYVLLYRQIPSIFAITVVDQADDHFTIAGDYRVVFPDGSVFEVTGSTGNDGTYTVDSTVLNGINTEIYVTIDIPHATADGFCSLLAQIIFDYFLLGDDFEILMVTNRNTATVSMTQLPYNWDITVADTANEHFTVAGNVQDYFPPGLIFTVKDSTGNDGVWVVLGTVISGANTEIYVTGNITDATADGIIYIPYLKKWMCPAVEDEFGVIYFPWVTSVTALVEK